MNEKKCEAKIYVKGFFPVGVCNRKATYLYDGPVKKYLCGRHARKHKDNAYLKPIKQENPELLKKEG